MSKLLRAGFFRLGKKRLFYDFVVFMFLFGAYLVMNIYGNGQTDAKFKCPDEAYFEFTLVIGIVCAVFCSIFAGTEHSDGTVRNKLFTGHRRGAVYLSNFLICTAAGFLFCAAHIMMMLVFGLPLLGQFRLGFGDILTLTLCALLLTAAYTALFSMIAMVCQNKALSAVICILLAVIMLFMAILINSRLQEPETLSDTNISFGGDGSMIVKPVDEYPNPLYVSGKTRQVFEFLMDFLPSGQALKLGALTQQLTFGDPEGAKMAMRTVSPPLMAVYSASIIVICTLAGMIVFRRRDVR